MLVTEGKTQVILDNLRDVQYMEECSDYGDQGYRLTSGTRIAFANWNDISDNVQKYLELIGYELQWNDEWIINYETDKCYRCQPDSYSWTPYYHITEGGEIIGGDEIETDADIAIGYINDHLINDFNHINLFSICNVLESMGFELHNTDEYESGWYGKNDSPEDIGNSLNESGKDYVFSGLRNSQFCINFDVWTRTKTDNQ